MRIKKIIACLMMGVIIGFYTNPGYTAGETQNVQKANTQLEASKKEKQVLPKIDETQYQNVNSIDVVNNPNNYLNKKVKMDATFDKFSTLGLDYKPAFRNSKDYISFLIRRNDVVDHVIPLSEMKLFLKRDLAEKFIDLESGDKVQIFGHVFSNALGDPWIEVQSLKITQKMPKKK